MNYLLLICGDETAAAHADDGCRGWDEEMRQRGVLRGAAALRPVADATTIRMRDGEVLVSDGPFAETKDQIGGFCLIDCIDLDEALQIAARHPAAAYGSIEIRPLRQP